MMNMCGPVLSEGGKRTPDYHRCQLTHCAGWHSCKCGWSKEDGKPAGKLPGTRAMREQLEEPKTFPTKCVVTWKDESTSTTNGAPGCRVGIHACALTNCTECHVCKCGAVHAVPVPPFGHHRIQVEDPQLIQDDGQWREGLRKDLGFLLSAQFVE